MKNMSVFSNDVGCGAWRSSLVFLGAIIMPMVTTIDAKNLNSRNRLVAPLASQDFLLAGIMDSPTHPLMHGMLRLGYVYALMLCAVDLKLKQLDSSQRHQSQSSPSRESLIKAKKVFSRLMQPMLVTYPVANHILGSTEAGLILIQKQIDYMMLRGS